jgi:hypothetical protein
VALLSSSSSSSSSGPIWSSISVKRWNRSQSWAGVVKIYNATNSIARFLNNNYFSAIEKRKMYPTTMMFL